MSAELIELPCEPPGESIDELIAELQEQHAKGLLSAVAVAVVYRDGSTMRGFSKLHSISTMIGAVELLKAKLISKWEEY